MSAKASIFRLDPETQSALLQLSRLLGRTMNKLVNEAVREYLLRVSKEEHELAQTLANLRAYRAQGSQGSPAGEAPAVNLTSRPEAEIMAAAREFIRRVSAVFPVKSAVLFGSRARGTHRPDSDLDIAVVLRGGRGNLMDTSLKMADIAFDLLLETKLYVQPVPIWEREWDSPETHSNPRLLDNIKREGLSL